MAKVITKEDVQAAADKAAAKATAAEQKRCIAAVKSVEVDAGDPLKRGYALCKTAAIAAIKAAAAE